MHTNNAIADQRDENLKILPHISMQDKLRGSFQFQYIVMKQKCWKIAGKIKAT